MEQDGAGREAEAGHVCTQLKPLETRVETQQQCELHRRESCKQKGWEIVYSRAHKAAIHFNSNTTL